MTTEAASLAWAVHRHVSFLPRNGKVVEIGWPAHVRASVPPDYAVRMPTTEVHDLMEALDATAATPFAWEAGARAAKEPTTALGLLLRASDNVGEVFDHLVRYWSVRSSSSQLERRVSDDRIELSFSCSTAEHSRGGALFAQYLLGEIVGFISHATGGVARPIEVRFCGAEAGHDPAIRQRLNGHTAVAFDSDFARVVYARSSQDVRLSTRDPLVARFLESELNRVLERMRAAITWQVDTLIRARLSTGIGMRDAAQELGLSERTLRRRLDDEGTSFRERMDRVRQSRALEMLSSNDVRTVAEELGFVDARSFQRAFRRWTEMTPYEYKRRLATS